MSQPSRRDAVKGAAAFAVAAAIPLSAAQAETQEEIDKKVAASILQLYELVHGTEGLAKRAKGVLVMPDIKKAGLIIGGAYGEGALLINGATAGYYSLVAASFGLQLGIQKTKQALFFMTDEALSGFRRADGWELGADAEFTVPGDGKNLQIDTTTSSKPVIALVFGQDGLLFGASFSGAKYSSIIR